MRAPYHKVISYLYLHCPELSRFLNALSLQMVEMSVYYYRKS